VTKRQAVITGVGVVSPFGIGTHTFWKGLAAGESAVRPIQSFDASCFPMKFAAEVPVQTPSADWVARQAEHAAGAGAGLSSGELTVLSECERVGALRDRKVAFGLLAALEAWRQADASGQDDVQLSLALGLEQAFLEDFNGFLSPSEGSALRWGELLNAASSSVRSGEARGANRTTRYRSRVDLTVDWIRMLLRLHGEAVTHSSACAAGALAVAHAAQRIERGTATMVLCGGSDSMVNPLGLGGMFRLGAPSPRNAPDACRPFDRRRDGLVIGEGAAMFVVEERSSAARRGAVPLARVLGWGSTQDGFKVTAPRPDGSAATRAMVAALTRAGLDPQNVGYINAHGTGTPLNDPAEVLAIRGALGAYAERVPVSSIKGAIGHTMAAAGALELAACLLALQTDTLPGTAHLREVAPDCALDVIGPAPRSARVDTVLSNSFGFGGQNATVILGRVSP
jgi:3-oxoacyl-[acyl-carrier-protein] synthase II